MTKKILTSTPIVNATIVANDTLPQDTQEAPVLTPRQRAVNTLIENITTFERQERDRRELHNHGAQNHVDGLCIKLTEYVADRLLAWDLVGVQPMAMPIEIDMLHPPGVAQIHLLSVKYSPHTPERMLSPFEIGSYYQPNASVPPAGNRLNILVEKHIVEAATRNLALRHTFFAAEDCLAATGVPLDIPTMLGAELLAELDWDMLRTLAYLATVAAPIKLTPQSFATTESDVLQCNIIRTCSLIGAKTRRGAGNWCVVSPKAYEIVRQAGAYTFIQEPSETQISHVGTLAGSIKVFHSPNGMPDADVLVGYKGNDIDAGLVYCPFILAYTNGVCIDPQTFEPVVLFRTRRGFLGQTKSDTRINDAADYYARFSIE